MRHLPCGQQAGILPLPGLQLLPQEALPRGEYNSACTAHCTAERSTPLCDHVHGDCSRVHSLACCVPLWRDTSFLMTPCTLLCCLQNHVCRPGALDAPCPICLQGPMFDSQSAAHMLPCGHFAHLNCINSCCSGMPANSICKACNPDDSVRRAVAGLTDRLRASNIADSTFEGSSSSGPSTDAWLGSGGWAGNSSNGRGDSSGYVQDLLGVLSGSYEASDAPELESMLKELEVASMLPPREVRVSHAVGKRINPRMRQTTYILVYTPLDGASSLGPNCCMQITRFLPVHCTLLPWHHSCHIVTSHYVTSTSPISRQAWCPAGHLPQSRVPALNADQ